MSIRFKLLISYILMIIIPIALFVLFLHLLFHLFVGNIEEVKNYYNIEENFIEELLQEDLILYTNLLNDARTNPDQLRDRTLLTELRISSIIEKQPLSSVKKEIYSINLGSSMRKSFVCYHSTPSDMKRKVKVNRDTLTQPRVHGYICLLIFILAMDKKALISSC